MRRIFLLATTITAAAAYFIFFWHSPTPLEKLPPDAVIVAFGDSLTAGTGSKTETGYPQRLGKILGREIINAGIPGETTDNALRRLPKVLEEHKPALIIVCTGGNDFLQRKPAEQTEENLREIIRAAKASGAAVALLAVPRILPHPLNHPLYWRTAKSENLWIEDEILKTILHDNRLKSDYVHPNDDGYQKLAEAVAAFLRRAGAV